MKILMLVLHIKLVFFFTFLFVFSVQATDSDSTATFGLRAGSNTIEGFADVFVPYSVSDNALVFVNPRFLLGDAGVDQINFGIGTRYLFEGKGVLGANLYYDKRESELGFDFEQLGLGLEWLGNMIDARINFYQAEDSLILANEFNTLETVTNTSVQERRSSQVLVSTEASNFGEGRASGNQIVQRAIITDTTTTIKTLTKTTTTTETQIGRLFEQYQGTLDGWDAEIGVKLPTKNGPEVRLFGGWYDFDDPFSNNNQLEGYKTRAEVRVSRYLTFDAEYYEEAHNGSDYFLGLRLEIPLKGKDTFKNLKENLWNSPQRSLRDRMNREMVMRDVQIHTDISKPIENEKARTVRSKQKVEVTSRTSASSSSTTRRGDVVAIDNVLFVDADNTGVGSGTANDPYKTIIEGVNNAGTGSTIFVCEHGGGVCDLAGGGGTYDETANGGTGIALQNRQTITSSITLNGGHVYETQNMSKIQNTAQTANNGVINTSGANAINRLDITAQTLTDARGIVNTNNTGDVIISNSTITTSGTNGYGIFSTGTNGILTISNNTIDTNTGNNAHGIFSSSTNGVVTINNNTVSTSNSNAVGVYHSRTNAETTISHNVINATSTGGNNDGIYVDSNKAAVNINNNTINSNHADGIVLVSTDNAPVNIINNTITANGNGDGITTFTTGTINASGNTITTKGTGNAFNLFSGGAGCNNFTGNTLDAQGAGNEITAGGTNQFSQASTAALIADNTLVNGKTSFSGSETFNCTP